MANRKISEFPSYPGTANADVFFIAASGSADNTSSSNYKLSFPSLSSGVNSIINGDYNMPLLSSGDYFVFQSKINSPKQNFKFLIDSDPHFSVHSGSGIVFHRDLHSISNINLSGSIVGGFGKFSEGLSVGSADVVTGFDFANDGDASFDGDYDNINLGGNLPNSTKRVNIRVAGVNKMTIEQDGDVYVEQKLHSKQGLYIDGESIFLQNSTFSSITSNEESLFKKPAGFSEGIRLLSSNQDSNSFENYLYNFNGLLKWQDTDIITQDLLSQELSTYVNNDTFFGELQNYVSVNETLEYPVEANDWHYQNRFYCPTTLGTYGDASISFEGSTSETLPELVKVSSVGSPSLLSIKITSTGNEDNQIQVIDSGGLIEIEYGELSTVQDLVIAINDHQDGSIIAASTDGDGSTLLTNHFADFENSAEINVLGPSTFSSPVYINNELYINGETYRSKIAELESKISLLESRISALE
jgi:hypothetical protein